MDMPTYDKMMQPTLRALENLGGSGRIEEIVEQVTAIMGLTDEITSKMHNPERSSQTEVEYRLAWARTYLKKFGLLENSARGVWAFTEKYTPGTILDPIEIVQFVRDQAIPQREEIPTPVPVEPMDDNSQEDETTAWRNALHAELQSLKPDAFERLAQRLLREIGFVQVDVLGRTGDGGIDGKGIVKLQKILSYHVFFQCKRYKDSVASSDMRDFRGAIVGRADKGLFITTGRFTRDAIKEATRDGAPPIDLIDGEALVDLLKELGLGVAVHVHTVEIENVEVDKEWFISLDGSFQQKG